jgi:hypothetical protein
MVHNLNVKAVKVGNIAGNVEGENLPLTRRQNFITAGEAVED